ncbi:MAG: hypothetical protein R2795_14180 [Saprospiraceae bacterium]
MGSLIFFPSLIAINIQPLRSKDGSGRNGLRHLYLFVLAYRPQLDQWKDEPILERTA